MEDKTINLLKKLKALADRGEGGEKVNAQRLLKEMLEKHNLTIEDIEGEAKKDWSIKVSREKKQFFYQIVASVVGKDVEIWRSRARGHIIVELTPSQFIEIQSKFDFYWKVWKKEVDLFYNAFVQKQQIYVKRNPNENRDDNDELTEDELRMIEMMRGIKKYTHYKQIESHE